MRSGDGRRERRIASSGFTLIELVIAISIIALTLAFSGPELEKISKSQKIKSVAREIYTNLQLARMTAIKEDGDIIVTFGVADGSRPTMAIHRKDDDSPVVPDKDFSQEFQDVVLGSSRTDGNRGIVTFTSNGTIYGNQNQSIQVTHIDPDIDREYDVVINSTGGIRFERSTKDS